MENNKQIEEMAKVMHDRAHEIAEDPYGLAKLSLQGKRMPDDFAEVLYNAGYRKASDVAREIIETLESVMEEPITEWHKGYFAALSDVISMLKKKYTEGENDKQRTCD